MIQVTIDGRAISVAEGTTILDAARTIGIEIPALCDRGAGKPALTSCMVCVVRVNGSERLLPACATRVQEQMRVESESPAVRQARRTALELLLSDHVGPCVAPCQSVCPAHMHIDRMLEQISREDWAGAISTIKKDIPLPAILGRICPELCEKGCRRKSHDAPVAICRLKREAADRDLGSSSPYYPPVAPATGKRVAVIGAGPAGLTAAFYLACAGHECTLYDRNEAPGGSLLKRTTPEQLPREVIEAEIAQIRRVGVRFVMGASVDAAALKAEHDAVLIATGESAPVQTDRQTARTTFPGIFATGAATGASSKHAVQVVADGHFAAGAVCAFLAGLPPLKRAPDWNCSGPAPAREELAERVARASTAARQDDPDDRDWATEAGRCLRCGCPKQNNCTLREVAAALDANPNRYRGEHRARTPLLSATLPDGRTIALDHGKCIACGRCIAIAEEAVEPYGLAWVDRGFAVQVMPALGVDLATALQRSADWCVRECPTAAVMIFDAIGNIRDSEKDLQCIHCDREN